MDKTRVLVVDDEAHHAEATCESLSRAGYDVVMATSGSSGLEKINHDQFDVVVTDLVMKDVDGMEVLRQAKKRTPDAAVIVMTAYGTIDSAVETMRRGADDYVEKPLNIHRLRQVVEKAVDRQRLSRENFDLHRQLDKRYGFEGIIGNTDQMQRVLDVLNQISETNVTVLIQGETGTGKELVAKAIHNNSPRKNNKILPLNCAALSEGVLESELFGHEKGAFTSALVTRKGYFEFADKGTLFLDEIGEMPLTTQVKLLRVIEYREVVRVGSTKSVPIDVRLVAATNKRLEEMVKEGKFREDLFYRLKVVTIDLPPLRDRQVDMPLLVDHFIKEFNYAHNKKIAGMAPEARKLLHGYHWPGNVRELRNLVESVFIDPPDGLLDLDHLAPAFQALFRQYRTTPDSERAHMIAVLEHHQWNKAEAAKALQCSRMTLYRKLAKYHVTEGMDPSSMHAVTRVTP